MTHRYRRPVGGCASVWTGRRGRSGRRPPRREARIARKADDDGRSPARCQVWVDLGDEQSLARINANTSKLVFNKPFEGGACECVAEMAIADRKLWVSSGPPQARLEARALESGEREYGPRGDPGFEGAFAVDGNAVWLVGNDEAAGGAWLRWFEPTAGREGPLTMLEQGLFASGVAVGREGVWVADAKDGLVIPFDPESEIFGSPVEVPKGISGDDLVAVEGGALVWNAATGWLSRISYKTMAVTSELKVDGYTTDAPENAETSQLAADHETAWVTDPAGNAVFRVRYRPRRSGSG